MLPPLESLDKEKCLVRHKMEGTIFDEHTNSLLGYNSKNPEKYIEIVNLVLLNCE